MAVASCERDLLIRQAEVAVDTASGVGGTRHRSAGVKASAKGEQHMRVRDEGQSLPSGLGRSTAKGKGERGRDRKGS